MCSINLDSLYCCCCCCSLVIGSHALFLRRKWDYVSLARISMIAATQINATTANGTTENEVCDGERNRKHIFIFEVQMPGLIHFISSSSSSYMGRHSQHIVDTMTWALSFKHVLTYHVAIYFSFFYFFYFSSSNNDNIETMWSDGSALFS